MSDGTNKTSGRIRVAVRVRPQSEGEKGCISCIEPKKLVVRSMSAGSVIQEKKFEFDLCAHEGFSQEDIFEHSGTSSLLDAANEGLNVTIMAYGATGSGKTYTILGNDHGAHGAQKGDSAGIIQRSAEYLFKKNHATVLLTSFYEIYDEKVYDLIGAQEEEKNCLSVRHNVKLNNFFVANLTQLECNSTEDISAIISEGAKNRRRASHKLNRDSSRGHAVLSMKIFKFDAKQKKIIQIGKINFVDLAGSERLDRSKSANFNETASINRSLFTLQKVISALTASSLDSKKKHIPYRDSTLTKLLMDSFTGDVLTLLLACVSPCIHQVDQSLQTLYYAHQAKGIKNSPTIKLVSLPTNPVQDQRDCIIFSLQAQIQRLLEENKQLHSQLQQLSSSHDMDLPYKNHKTSLSSKYPPESHQSITSTPSKPASYTALESARKQQQTLQTKYNRINKQEHDAYTLEKLKLDAATSHQEHWEQEEDSISGEIQPPPSTDYDNSTRREKKIHPSPNAHYHSPSQPKKYSMLTSPLLNAHSRDEYHTSGEQRHQVAGFVFDYSGIQDHSTVVSSVHRQPTGDVVRRHREGLF